MKKNSRPIPLDIGKVRVGALYEVFAIHPSCEWFRQREDFEGKTMKCIEIFKEENAAGFCFVNQSDCPAGHRKEDAFCFYRGKYINALPTSGSFDQ